MSRRTRVLLFALLGLLAAGVYANTLRNGFALDDEAIIVENDRVHGIEFLPMAIDSSYWPRGNLGSELYRPLTTATYVVNWELAGPVAWSYHAVNVVLHAAVTLALLALLLQLGAPLRAALVGAAVFAVHPVHVEAVANVVGRAELLAALFYLLACSAYLRRDWRPAVRLPLVTFAYFLSMGAKEMGVTLPVVLLLLEALAAADFRDFTRRVRRELPAFVAISAAAAAFLLLRSAAMDATLGDLAAPELQNLSPFGRIATAIRVWPEYLRLLVFPARLVADYAPGVIRPVGGFDAMLLAGLLLGLAAAVVAARAWRPAPLLSLGVLWFAITILPVSNLLIPIGVVLAERTLYLPSVGLALALAGLVPLLVRRATPHARSALVAALALALVFGAVRTWTRNPVWRSTGSLVRDLAARHPESFRVQWMLATTQLAHGDTAAAIRAYDAAVAEIGNHYNLLLDYATALMRIGRYPAAAAMAERARHLVPGYTEPYLVQSSSLMYQGRHREAIDVLHEGLRLVQEPTRSLYDNLAYAYAESGQWQAALRAREVAISQARSATPRRQLAHLEAIRQRLGLDSAGPAERR